MALLVDACVLVELLLDGPKSGALTAKLGHHEMWVPQVTVSETLSVIARAERAGEVTGAAAAHAVATLARAPLNWVDDQALVARAWELRHFLRSTDSLYVAAAEQYQVPLLTIDLKLARAVQAQVPSVPVITL